MPSDDRLLSEILVALANQWVADCHLDAGERAAAGYAVASWLDFARRVAPLIVDRLMSPILPGSLLEGVLQQCGASPGPGLDRLVFAIAAGPGATLERLGLQLGDLEKGKVGAMLTPVPSKGDKVDKSGTKRGKHPPVAAKVQQIRAEVAGSVQLLFDAGSKLEDAAKRVARELKDHPILANVRGQHWRTILNWRSEIGDGVGDVEHYNAFLSLAKSALETFGCTSADLVNRLLQRLQKP